MQSELRCPEPRLATLLALVGCILGLTGLCVASYLAEDAARAAVPAGQDQGCEMGCLGRAGAVRGATEGRSGELMELAPACAPAPCVRPAPGRVKVG